MAFQRFLAIFGLLAFASVRAQQDCSTAPTDALKIFCEQLQRWDTSARDAAKKLSSAPALPPGLSTGSAGGLPTGLDVVPTSYETCLTIQCACQYLGGTFSGDVCNLSGGKAFKKIVRKEYRAMSDDERGRFHAVMNILKNRPDTDPAGNYNKLAKIHSQTGTSGGAHSGPAFLPWHREYIKRLEFLIRKEDPTLYLPYWDSALDSALPKPADSIMFTDYFMGTTDNDGNLVSGPFKDWKTLNANKAIRRKIGAQGAPFTDSDVQSVLKQTTIEKVLAYSAPQAGCEKKPDWNALEYTHGNVHIFIGGDMLDQSTSANDPVFFLHHCFVDHIWELWRQQKQDRDSREEDYPEDNGQCSGTAHFLPAIMKPFAPMQNKDGLLNDYTDYLYEYAPRPTCPSCGGSSYLFCDSTHGTPRCAAKVKLGGACNGFTKGEDVCYGGTCDGAVCKEAAVTIPPPPPPPPVTTTTAAPIVTESCFNEHQCCSIWAKDGECPKNKAYMDLWCKASCGICTPVAYDLNADCNDRHLSCAKWATAGECTNNPSWMTENCRSSCKLCGKTREQSCPRATTTATTTPSPAKPPEASTGGGSQQCFTGGCWNEHQCCPLWARLDQCRTNATFMSCNCRVSCGICTPTDYDYGGCQDFNSQCPTWSRQNQCSRPWMQENCRKSCRNCPSRQELERICGFQQARNNYKQQKGKLGSGFGRNFGGFGGGRRGFHGGGFGFGWG